jgi:membrane-associated phospholipid phosphatase
MRVSSRTLLLGAAGCAGLFCLLLVLAYLSPWAQELDASALRSFVNVPDYRALLLMDRIRHVGDPGSVALLAALLASAALLRGRPRLALAVVGLLAVTSVSSQVLKTLLAHPRYESTEGFAELPPASFPSGHSTAAMALAVGLVLVAPPRLRPLAAIAGCGLALAVGLSLVGVSSHFPSDVAGGFLLAAGCGLLMVVALRRAELRWPEPTGGGRVAGAAREATAFDRTGVVLAGVGLLLLGAVAIAIARPDAVLDAARDHTAAVLVGSALAALAAGLLGGITLGLRRS